MRMGEVELEMYFPGVVIVWVCLFIDRWGVYDCIVEMAIGPASAAFICIARGFGR